MLTALSPMTATRAGVLCGKTLRRRIAHKVHTANGENRKAFLHERLGSWCGEGRRGTAFRALAQRCLRQLILCPSVPSELRQELGWPGSLPAAVPKPRSKA